ncbi:MAG TPA: DNA polymerase Y family protein [Limnobacter sp.]|nr:DNA polymerase Y family protein [Limnobacter sp.]
MRWIAVSFKQNRKLQEANPSFDADRLFELASRFSPTVAWRQDQHSEHEGWLVEVQSSFRLFGGASALLSKFWQEFEEFSDQLQLGNWPTATGAWWLSKGAPANTEADFLDMLNLQEADLLRLPVHVLDCGLSLQHTWQQCGFSCLGNLWQLPRAGFLKRFGQAVLAELDSGLGVQNKQAPLTVVHSPDPVFNQSIELPFHSNRTELLEHHAAGLLKALCKWLEANKKGTRELKLTFLQSRREWSNNQQVLQLRSGQATRCEKTWQRLLHHQLGRMKFKDDIHSLQLLCAYTETLADQNHTLLPDPVQNHADWDNTCDLLRARLGEQTVLFAASENDPRPECSIVLQSAPVGRQATPADKKPPGLSFSGHTPEPAKTGLQASTPRPLWLLPEPRKLQGAAPGWQSSNAWHLLSGPERVEFGWWDGQPCKRDYYCARNSQQSLVWLYQDLLEDSGAWFLHGYFA